MQKITKNTNHREMRSLTSLAVFLAGNSAMAAGDFSKQQREVKNLADLTKAPCPTK
jgi:hypothetical protein